VAGVRFEDVGKTFGDVHAVRSLSLEIFDGEFMVLVGPSGSGKTTALRMLAGLESVTSGSVFIGDALVNRVAPRERDIAMVFQDYALYPQMSVFDNLAFGLRRRKVERSEIQRRVDEAARVLDIGPLLQRKPGQLSGGQAQRVALGRALVRDPQVFLMDEPLSNLDAKLRVQTRAEIIKLHRRLGITTVYVTHDQVEAMTMGDRIAVMSDGLLQQVDTPLHLYNHPANQFVAGFIGSPSMNFAAATVEKAGSDVWLQLPGLRLKLLPERAALLNEYVGKTVTFGIRPEDIFDASLSQVEAAEGNRATATVDVTEMMGDRAYLYLTFGDGLTWVANVESETQAKDEQPLEVVFDLAKSHAFDPQTEGAIY
jgi:multiple sugar transport system ATP-binding protein